MHFWDFIFFISCLLVFYNYAGYAIIVYLVNALQKKESAKENNDFFPSVSFIVAAFNEEDCIRQKIINSLEQNYPADKIEYIFITDGSSDNTPEIIRTYSSVHLLHSPERKGKSAALNRAVSTAKNEILIFSDANTLLNKNAIRNIASHYKNEKVGGVAGEKKVTSLPARQGEVGPGEGMYWKYESFLKKIDSEFYSVVGAAGELFSVRKQLYEPIKDNVILDDFVISLQTAQRGYRIIYAPDAYATELPSFSLHDEQKRKIRITAGGFQAIWILRSLFYFWKHPKLSFLYISHRFLRWAVTPLCLILALISNGILFFTSDNYLFKILFITQLCFYTMAFIGSFIPKNNQLKILKFSYYFVFMNISVIRGFFRFLRGQSAIWEKAKRQQSDK